MHSEENLQQQLKSKQDFICEQKCLSQTGPSINKWSTNSCMDGGDKALDILCVLETEREQTDNKVH